MIIRDPPNDIDLDLFKQKIPNQSIRYALQDVSPERKKKWTLTTHESFTDSETILNIILGLSKAEFVYEIRLQWSEDSSSHWYIMSNGKIIKIIGEAIEPKRSDFFNVCDFYIQVFDWTDRAEINTTTVVNEICTAANNVVSMGKDLESYLLLLPQGVAS